jgi:ribonuclease BN (tRNA processing enzyme)
MRLPAGRPASTPTAYASAGPEALACSPQELAEDRAGLRGQDLREGVGAQRPAAVGAKLGELAVDVDGVGAVEDHFGGLPLLILDGQFSRRTRPLAIAGPPGTGRRLAEAMECLFPGSGATSRRFSVEITELEPGTARTVCGITVRAWEGDHPSGAPALVLRLEAAGKAIAYTGDTAWTDAIAAAAVDADLLIAEAYYRDKDVPYHLRLADLKARRDRIGARRTIITHMSADMLGHQHEAPFEAARDGLVISL